MFDCVQVKSSRLIPRRRQVLYREGVPVWYGEIGAPIEDAVFDMIMVHPDDYHAIGVEMSLRNRRLKGE